MRFLHVTAKSLNKRRTKWWCLTKCNIPHTHTQTPRRYCVGWTTKLSSESAHIFPLRRNFWLQTLRALCAATSSTFYDYFTLYLNWSQTKLLLCRFMRIFIKLQVINLYQIAFDVISMHRRITFYYFLKFCDV